MGFDVLIIVFLVAFAAAVLLAAAETSLLRISSVRAATLAEEGGRQGKRLAQLIGRLPRVLNTILLTALLSQIVAAPVVGIVAERWFGSLGVTLASIVLTIVLFIYAEAISKTYAFRHAERVALAMSIVCLRPWTRIHANPASWTSCLSLFVT